ncbi:unnamed protein product [Oikopleura dioica]|uniref:Hypoxanthine phosphoribosyltransferase n=1 Tax=Oikopleura dioica TaxID=34765 RepID=E4YIU6_OIKDI|nr:unnamed protein product [Oikopleura dioica]
MKVEELLKSNDKKDIGIVVPDNWQSVSYDCDQFALPTHYKKYLERVILPRGLVLDRTEKLVLDLFHSLDRSVPVVALCVLKGGFQYFADVCDNLKRHAAAHYPEAIQFNMDFIRLKSYEDDRANEEVQVIGGDNLEHLRGKQVIVVEDIVDTGNTIRKLMNVLAKYDPKSVKVVTMLSKRTPLNTSGYVADFSAFSIPVFFAVGYALDYNEYFRDLNHVCVLNNEGIEKFSAKNLPN